MPENKRSKLSLSRRGSIASPATKLKENEQSSSSSTPLHKSDIRKFLVRSNEKTSKKERETSLSTDLEASKEDPPPTIDEKSKELTVMQDPEIFQALKDLFAAVSYKLSVRPISAAAPQSVFTHAKPKKKSLSSSREDSSCPEVGARASKTIGQKKRQKKTTKRVSPIDREAIIQELLNCSRSSST